MQVKDKEMIVVSVVGPQRTGKSFLCNMLVNSMNSFELGNSTLPQTKGIYMWPEPLILNDQAILVLDTEGLNSVFRDKHIDGYIMSIALILSSVFVYNNFGVINEKELEDLAAAIELTNWIDEKEIVPYFLWCLRDFVLDSDDEALD
jgi:hypothetical protein